MFWSALTVNYFNTSLLINSTHNLLVFEISLGGRGGGGFTTGRNSQNIPPSLPLLTKLVNTGVPQLLAVMDTRVSLWQVPAGWGLGSISWSLLPLLYQSISPILFNICANNSVLHVGSPQKWEGGLTCIIIINIHEIINHKTIKQLKIPIFVTFPSNLILQN